MLTRVTITGADDLVEPSDLADISREFPFVEWGILISDKRAGTVRYPSVSWIGRLLAVEAKAPMLLSAHLCGRNARAAMDLGELGGCPAAFGRIQLNGYDGVLGWPFVGAIRATRAEFILQIQLEQGAKRAVRDALLIGDHRGSILYDPSGGTGRETCYYPSPLDERVRVGYAGGIGPHNVVDVCATLRSQRAKYWIDMESKVRTEDRFDLAKAREVLQLAERFVVRE